MKNHYFGALEIDKVLGFEWEWWYSVAFWPGGALIPQVQILEVPQRQVIEKGPQFLCHDRGRSLGPEQQVTPTGHGIRVEVTFQRWMSRGRPPVFSLSLRLGAWLGSTYSWFGPHMCAIETRGPKVFPRSCWARGYVLVWGRFHGTPWKVKLWSTQTLNVVSPLTRAPSYSRRRWSEPRKVTKQINSIRNNLQENSELVQHVT